METPHVVHFLHDLDIIIIRTEGHVAHLVKLCVPVMDRSLFVDPWGAELLGECPVAGERLVLFILLINS